MMRAMVDIGSVVMGLDGWSEGRGVRELGIEGMDLEALNGLLLRGEGLWGDQG